MARCVSHHSGVYSGRWYRPGLWLSRQTLTDSLRHNPQTAGAIARRGVAVGADPDKNQACQLIT